MLEVFYNLNDYMISLVQLVINQRLIQIACGMFRLEEFSFCVHHKRVHALIIGDGAILTRKGVKDMCWILFFVIMLVTVFTLEQYTEIEAMICNSKISLSVMCQ